MNILDGKHLLITGGTGSFGHEIATSLLSADIAKVTILSRDEKKQHDMRMEVNDERFEFIIGDTRDATTFNAVNGQVDLIFHAAALKQVPSCEFFPLEAVKTNILGSTNVLDYAVRTKVECVVCLSTDKAVYPINAMGMSKALMEKTAIARSRTSGNTRICVTRYGNVMGSRGSVIPLFVDQGLNSMNITVTNPNMTRFMMTLSEAVDLVMHAFSEGANGDLFVQKSPASTIGQLAKVICEKYGFDKGLIREIGTRHGEKDHEVLLSREERSVAKESSRYYRISSDKRDLNYSNYFVDGSCLEMPESYNSGNTYRLTDAELLKKLLKAGF